MKERVLKNAMAADNTGDTGELDDTGELNPLIKQQACLCRLSYSKA